MKMQEHGLRVRKLSALIIICICSLETDSCDPIIDWLRVRVLRLMMWGGVWPDSGWHKWTKLSLSNWQIICHTSWPLIGQWSLKIGLWLAELSPGADAFVRIKSRRDISSPQLVSLCVTATENLTIDGGPVHNNLSSLQTQHKWWSIQHKYISGEFPENTTFL